MTTTLTLTERILQRQHEIERLFAACAFISPEHVREVCGWLKPESFSDLRIRRFWERVLEGTSTVEASFDASLLIDLLDWSNDVPSFLAARDYANRIARSNYLLSVSERLGKIAWAVKEDDADSVRSLIDGIAQARPLSDVHPPTALDIQLEFIQAIISDSRAILTGIPGLDNNTGGLERQTESVIAGRPSMGKTAIALQIARNVAGPGGLRVIFFSLEMSRVSMWARAACPQAGVTWMDVKARKLTQEQEGALFRESAELANYYGKRLMIDDQRHTTDTIWSMCANERPDLVIVDHLRLVKDKNESEVKRQGLIAERLKEMSKELNCHVSILAQLSRKVEERKGDKRPILSDLRDSGEIEETADQVFMLYRDDYYNPPDKPGAFSRTELWIRKFRDGQREARINLAFDEKRQWFDPLNAVKQEGNNGKVTEHWSEKV